MSVSLGNLSLSSPSSISRGSNAIRWSEDVSIALIASLPPGAGEFRPDLPWKEFWLERSGRDVVGEETASPPPATLRRCSPEDMRCPVVGITVSSKGGRWG